MLIIILLLLIAIGLILVEIFLIPGVGIPGIAGAALMLLTLFLAYRMDTMTGHYALAGTVVSSIALITLSLRSKTWERMSQKEEIKSRVANEALALMAGEQGTTVSRLSPAGTARFGEHTVEVHSRGELIEANSRVEILTIEGNKIIVKPINS